MKKALIITFIIVGALIALQVRSFRQVEFLIQRSGPGSVLEELRVFQLANQQLRENVTEEQKKLDELTTKISSQAIEDDIKKFRMLTGEDGISGEGVKLTLDRAVNSFWISDLIAQLVSAGAEAVSINDIRLTIQTAGLRDVGGGIVMRRHFIRPPIIIRAIGPKNEQKSAIAQNGGIMDRIKDNYPGIKITVTEEEKIVIPALSEKVPN